MKTVFKYLSSVIVCGMVFLILLLISDTFDAKAAYSYYKGRTTNKGIQTEQMGDLQLNDIYEDDIPEKTAYVFSFKIKKQGILTITGDFDVRKAVGVSIIDSYGKTMFTDNNNKNWYNDSVTGKDTIFVTFQLNPGQYYFRIANYYKNYEQPVSIDVRFKKTASVKSGTELSERLIRGSMAMYKVKMVANGTMNFKGVFPSSQSVGIEIYNSEGISVDKVASRDDWKNDDVTKLSKMDFTTKLLLKGIYYIKVSNLEFSELDCNLKFSIEIPSTKLKVSPGKLSLKVGKSKKITTKLTPKKSTDILTWSSSNVSVAEVDNKGKIKAKAPGNATITVKTTSGLRKTIKVTVKK